MRARLLGPVLVAVLLWTPTALAGTINDIGAVDHPTDLDVGDGTRDGRNEVFVAAVSGVHMLQASGGNWSQSLVGSLEALAVVAGDGDRDGRVEVWAGGNDGGLRRFAWTGTAWNRNKVLTLPTPFGFLALGDVENDGLRELYAGQVGTANNEVHKVWFSGGVWQHRRIASFATSITGMALGDGDRDGQTELYVGLLNGQVHEVEGTGGAWRSSLVGTLTPGDFITAVAVGHAKHGPQQEVYAVDLNQQVVRFVWDGDSWFKQTIGFTDWVARELDAADLDGDGRHELYTGTDGGRFYQHRWDGTAWRRALLAAGSGGVDGMDVGDGDNDGLRELYASTSTDHVYRVVP